MDSHMDDTTEAMPYDVAPFAEMIEYAFILAALARSKREGEEGGSSFWMGMPPTFAVDQAT